MKTLLLDIETAPNVAYVWGLFKENIPLARIVESGYVLCWAAKWLGESEVMFDSVHKSKPKKMLKRIHELLDEADAVVHYNGNSFDIPTLNKEFLLHGMMPPSPSRQIDLLVTARKRFRFLSNKMDYVAQALGVGKKKNTSFELWVACMNNDAEAWAKMEEYNRGDVEILAGIFEVFRPWVRGLPNAALYSSEAGSHCPACNGSRLIRRGFAYTTTGRYQRYHCQDCGHWSRDRLGISNQPGVVSV